MQRLKEILRKIDHRGYSAYQELKKRQFQFSTFELFFDHIQKDPFAPATKIRVRIPQDIAKFPGWTFKNRIRRVALEDFLLRELNTRSHRFSKKRGEGKSGAIFSYQPSQRVLERSAIHINEKFLEARFFIGLPSRGRRILGNEAEAMVFYDISRLIRYSLFYENLVERDLERHIKTIEDAEYLRNRLNELGLVCFVANGSILPRRSGVDDRPMDSKKATPFIAPQELESTIELPNYGAIKGMGIPEGVVLIIGGGFHGKSTLLRAIQDGIYNHIPGDGREFVVTVKQAIKIRAEDGRSIVGVDISPFISNLPQKVDTRNFTTENASGSTSQAANIIEAIEAGAKLLLIDEDTSATNFMIRDSKMRSLVPDDLEPITPFIDKVRPLFNDYHISTILVTGGSGEYLKVADSVICMQNYLPKDFTARVKKLGIEERGEGKFGLIRSRIPLKSSLNPEKRPGKTQAKAKGLKKVIFGPREIDISQVEQIVELGQSDAIANALVYIYRRLMDDKKTMSQIYKIVEHELVEKGVESFSTHPKPAHLAEFRILDFAFTLNRIRGLKIINPP